MTQYNMKTTNDEKALTKMNVTSSEWKHKNSATETTWKKFHMKKVQQEMRSNVKKV